jgi:hypothetical protein
VFFPIINIMSRPVVDMAQQHSRATIASSMLTPPLGGRHDLPPSGLVASKQLLDRCDLVLHGLRFVRPATNADVALNAHNAVFV